MRIDSYINLYSKVPFFNFTVIVLYHDTFNDTDDVDFIEMVQ